MSITFVITFYHCPLWKGYVVSLSSKNKAVYCKVFYKHNETGQVVFTEENSEQTRRADNVLMGPFENVIK